MRISGILLLLLVSTIGLSLYVVVLLNTTSPRVKKYDIYELKWNDGVNPTSRFITNKLDRVVITTSSTRIVVTRPGRITEAYYGNVASEWVGFYEATPKGDL